LYRAGFTRALCFAALRNVDYAKRKADQGLQKIAGRDGIQHWTALFVQYNGVQGFHVGRTRARLACCLKADGRIRADRNSQFARNTGVTTQMLQKIRLSVCYCYAGTKIFVPFSRSAFSLFNVPYTQRSIPLQLVCRVFPSKLFRCFLYPEMAI
jgi:hypothetical protein